MTIAEIMAANARDWLAFAETAEAKALGLSREEVRPRLAARIKEAPGTIENLFRKRLKSISGALHEKARREFLRWAEWEVSKLETEMARAQAGSCDADRDDAREILAHLTAVRAIVARRKGMKNAA